VGVQRDGQQVTLTEREMHVLEVLCGTSPQMRDSPPTVRQVAGSLRVAEATIRQHLSHLYRKLGVPPGPRRVARLASQAAAVGLAELAAGCSVPVAASGTNPRLAHSARVQDYWLGGKDHYAVDRKAGDLLLQAAPGLARSVRESRRFLDRAVRHLAGEYGIGQFLDIGAGLPCLDNTHEIAQRVQPLSRIVYADTDPVMVAFGRALLTSNRKGTCDYIQADARDTDAIVAGAARTLDFTEPVAILLLGVLDYLPRTSEVQAVVRSLLSPAAPGSALVVSCLTAEECAGAMTEAAALWNEHGSPPITLRTPGELAGFFDGLDLIGPGLVPWPRWLPDAAVSEPAEVPHFCGVGRKQEEASRA
jgi:O-methyltransferase involved in polyketide biosynthesis